MEADDFQRADRLNSCVACGEGQCGGSRGWRARKPSEDTSVNEGTPQSADLTRSEATNAAFKKPWQRQNPTSDGERVGNGNNLVDRDSEESVTIDTGVGGLNRFSIVPHCFRRLLPPAVKGRSSHDVVLLCCMCRDKAQVRVLRTIMHCPLFCSMPTLNVRFCRLQCLIVDGAFSMKLV